jgi:uncharacterized protein YndB with AHSA1/START domain
MWTERRAMPQFSDSIEIARPPEDVWRAIGTPERWFEGYLETRSRSEDYPGPETRDDHLYRTRTIEEVGARVTRSEAPTVLEEDQEGKTFSRHVRYRLTPSDTGTSLRIDDEVSFKGLGKLAAPIASRDIKKRWQTSLEKLKVTTEGRQ